MKKIFLSLILIPILSLAQTIHGVVLDKNNNLPIEGVNITINGLSSNTMTDKEGKFYLTFSTKKQEIDSVHFSHISYQTRKISFQKLIKNDFTVLLDEKIDSIDEIILNHKKQLNTKINFTKLAPSKYALFSTGAILKDKKIMIIGGDASFKSDAFKKVQYEKVDPTMADYLLELSFQFSGQSYKGNLLIYDIKTNVWETSKLKFRKRAYHSINEYNNKIYILGGKRVSANGVFEYLDDKIEVFDLNTQTITIDNTNPHQAADFASFLYNDNLIVMGGSTKMNDDGVKTYSNKVHSYNIKSGYWYELDNMPTAKETNGILINNKIYLIGGFNSKPLNAIESFDLLTGKWVNEGELFKSLSRPGITNDGSVIYFFDNERIYTFDINSRQLKEYQIDLPLQSSKLFYSDDKLYLYGGFFENYYSTNPSANLYSIDINEFTNTKPLRIKFL